MNLNIPAELSGYPIFKVYRNGPADPIRPEHSLILSELPILFHHGGGHPTKSRKTYFYDMNFFRGIPKMTGTPRMGWVGAWGGFL